MVTPGSCRREERPCDPAPSWLSLTASEYSGGAGKERQRVKLWEAARCDIMTEPFSPGDSFTCSG